jgi:hypothetical protein
MAADQEQYRPIALSFSARSDSSSSTSSLKVPRTPRFAEATSVHSPIDPNTSPFADPPEHTVPVHGQVGDVGFGYLGSKMETDNGATATMPMTPKTPLKSALKSSGPPRSFTENPLSPTFREEDILEKNEKATSKEQKRDLAIKARVRMAKFALRGVNFSCSLIIISMLATTLTIFNATRALPSRGGFTPWAPNASAWPQILVLTMACISLAACILVFVAYFRGGHRRAEKVAAYYTLFAVGWFILSMIIWAVIAAVYQHSRNNSGNKDLWGWACLQNKRSDQYSDEIAFALVCRLNNWALICIIIEVVVEVICITLYSIVFYRYWSKRRLHKSMDRRDKARSDLYLAQLRSQSAPNTPGFAAGAIGGPKSPALSQYAMSPRFPPKAYRNIGDMEDSPFTPAPVDTPRSQFESTFKLQAPPSKAPSATPKIAQGGFATNSPVASSSRDIARTPSPPTPQNETVQAHAPVSDDEPQYAPVAIPGAYADAAVKSPPPNQGTFGGRWQ